VGTLIDGKPAQGIGAPEFNSDWRNYEVCVWCSLVKVSVRLWFSLV